MNKLLQTALRTRDLSAIFKAPKPPKTPNEPPETPSLEYSLALQELVFLLENIVYQVTYIMVIFFQNFSIFSTFFFNLNFLLNFGSQNQEFWERLESHFCFHLFKVGNCFH